MTDSTPPNIETFRVPALDCAEELRQIDSGLRGQSGIGRIVPNYIERTIRVEFDGEQVSSEEVAASIRRLGFAVEPVDPSERLDTFDVSKARLARPTAVGGCLLLIAAAVWLVVGSTIAVDALLVASTIASGWNVARAALRAVRLRRLDMNALMTIAAIGATATGEFSEAATAMFLFGVSLWLESLSMGRARRAVRSLIELSPQIAHREIRESSATALNKLDDAENDTSSSLESVDPAVLRLGDVVIVKPGERVPVDGVVLSGASAVNQSPITGESVPVEKSTGDQVFAGTLNGEGALRVETTHEAAESTLAHIARLVEQAQASRSPTERFVDHFARRYTPAVIVLAVLLAVVPPLVAMLTPGAASNMGTIWLDWFHRSLVLLVIACPCALVISTPITIVCGLHRAARRGMLVKGGEFLESAGRMDAVALDKTGTLTTGVAEVVAVETTGEHTSNDVLRVAAALEEHSEHPLAKAIVDEAVERNVAWTTVQEFEALRGMGIQGQVDGRECFVGTRRLLEQRGMVLPEGEDRGSTAAWVAADKEVIGVIWLADRLRDDAAESLRELNALGVGKLAVLTGDAKTVARRLVDQLPADLDIEVHAELLPEDKVEHAEQLRRNHPYLAVVGDGVNDAPALAAARLGVAMGSQSSDTALETADVVMMAPKLSRLPELVRLGRKCRRVLAQNISFALAVKVVVLVLAAFGWATMWMAVAADVGASMVVIANAMRMIGK